MKVLEVTDFYYPWIAGPAPFIRNLATGLAERDHDVVIACPSPTGRRFDEAGPPRMHHVRTWPVPFGYRLRSGMPLVDLNRLVSRWRPDVIHVHHPFPISSAGVLAARVHKVPVVATNHTIPDCTLFGLKHSRLYYPAKTAFAAYISWLLGRAQAVTTPTETAADMLRAMGFTGSVHAISNGVDVNRFRPRDSFHTPIADPPAPPTVLYTGRLDDDKDMDTFIEAIPHVLAITPARFRIGGEGTDRHRLERRVKATDLAHAVDFTGYVSDADLPTVFNEATLYAISSTVELQSISTLEAMASGLPIVAVDAGALPELVRTKENGLLVPPRDARAFGRAIATILLDVNMRDAMGCVSRRIAEGHSVDQMVQSYERLFIGMARRSYSGAVHGLART